MSKPALIFFFTARVHTTKSTVNILAANTHYKYFLKIAPGEGAPVPIGYEAGWASIGLDHVEQRRI
jgi:hypothetical protein